MIDWRREAERSLPKEFDDLAPEWLTAALRSHDSHVPAVHALNIERVGEGFGLTGAIGRIHLRWERVERRLPTSLIVKLPVAHSGALSLYRQQEEREVSSIGPYFHRCAREVLFYRELATRGSAPTPICYFAASSEEQVGIVLLLEDVEGVRQGDVIASGSFEEVAAAVEAIAPFHAQWWRGEPGAMPVPSWLPRWGGDYARRHERYRSQVGPFLER